MFEDNISGTEFLRKFLRETFTEKKKVSPSFAEEALRLCQLKEKLIDKSDNPKKSGWYWLGVSLVIPATIIGIVLWVLIYGFVAMKLWSWFIVPIFDIKPITCLQAAGLVLILRFAVCEYPSENNEGKTTFQKNYRMAALILLPWLYLLTGYIIHRFI